MSRQVFMDAARAAAFKTEEGRTIVHCLAGWIGADWDLDAVLREIESADDVRWERGPMGHDLMARTGRRYRQFHVKQPEASHEG